jgi:uncharacterized protein (TIGR02246 family)
MKKILIQTLLVLIACSCQREYSTVEDEKSIAEFNKQWNQNALSGNRVANAELFTEDGVRIEAGKVYKGREAIRSFLSMQSDKRKYIQQENKTQRIWSAKDFITAELIQTQVFIQSETGDTIIKRNAAIAIFSRQPDGSLELAYNLKTELTEK